MKRKLLTIFILIILSISAFAQMEVKEGSFKEVEGFVNINTDIMFDDNDKPYAVLKVKTENINDKERHQLLFQGDARTFFEVEYKVGEVWLYISYYATYIKISHPDFGSTEFWFPFDMKGKKGYELTLVNKPSIEEDFMQRLLALETATANGRNTGEFGYVVVRTTPVNNATVLIDGDEMETKTPYVSDKLSVGPHRIRVIKEHYQPYVTVVDIEKGKTNYLDVKLVHAVGSMKIVTNPASVDITVDDLYRGVTPKTMDNMQAGKHQVKLSKKKYETIVKEVEVKDGENTLVEVEMQMVQSFRRNLWVLRPEIGIGIIQRDLKEYDYYYNADKKTGSRFAVNVNAGYHFTPYFYLGAGSGVNIVTYEKTMLTAPLYVNPRFYVNNMQNSLYFDFKMGISINLKSADYDHNVYGLLDCQKFSGFYGAFEIGVEKRHSSFGLSVGMQNFHSVAVYYYKECTDEEYTKNQIYIMLKYGFSIFLNKK